jgi:hypothetical protein
MVEWDASEVGEPSESVFPGATARQLDQIENAAAFTAGEIVEGVPSVVKGDVESITFSPEGLAAARAKARAPKREVNFGDPNTGDDLTSTNRIAVHGPSTSFFKRGFSVHRKMVSRGINHDRYGTLVFFLSGIPLQCCMAVRFP